MGRNSGGRNYGSGRGNSGGKNYGSGGSGGKRSGCPLAVLMLLGGLGLAASAAVEAVRWLT